MAKIITYDLRKPGTNYDGLIARIKQYTHCKLTESCWLVSTTWTTAQIRDDLKDLLDVNDRLLLPNFQETQRGLVRCSVQQNPSKKY